MVVVTLNASAIYGCEETLAQKQKPTKSEEWLEVECLKLARQTLGGSEIQRVTIRRLRPKGTGPNLKGRRYHPAAGPAAKRRNTRQARTFAR